MTGRGARRSQAEDVQVVKVVWSDSKACEKQKEFGNGHSKGV